MASRSNFVKMISVSCIFIWYLRYKCQNRGSYSLHSSVASVDNWGGRIFIYRVLHYQFLLKSIVFKVCEHEYMNIRPSNYQRWLRHRVYKVLKCKLVCILCKHSKCFDSKRFSSHAYWGISSTRTLTFLKHI